MHDKPRRLGLEGSNRLGLFYRAGAPRVAGALPSVPVI